MPAEARISTTWKRQKLLVGLLVVGFGGYFFFDGSWTWPRSNVRWLAYEKFKTESRLTEWPAYAESQGWVEEQPHKFYDEEAIKMQFVFGTLLVAIGAIVLGYWATQIRRVVKMDDEAVYTAAGTRVPFGAITGVGKKQWETKGIARVRYELDGRKGQFVVDDYKFDTDPSREILKAIEDRLLARAGGSDASKPA